MGERELPEGWESINLGELEKSGELLFQNGFACGINNQEGRGIPQLRPMNVSRSGQINLESLKFIETDRDIKSYLLQPNDVIFNNTNSSELVGKTAVWQGKSDDYVLSNHMTIIRILQDSHIDPNFLSQYFNLLWKKRFFENICQEHINQASVSLERLREIEIPLPPLSIQRQIVAVLEQAEAVKQYRQEADALTGALLQSVFYEMFGDPVTNVRGWTVKRIKDVAMIEKNVVNPDESNESYQTYVGLENIEKETGKLTQSSEIDSNEIKSAKFRFSNEHILYGKLRPYLNKVALPDFDGICSTDILTIKPLLNESTREFLCYLLRQKYFVDFANERSIGANLPRVSPNTILDFKAPIPPLALQWQFARVVQEVERLREKQVASGRHIEGLCEGLMQRAFAGELVA